MAILDADGPAQIGLLLDRSGSMGKIRAETVAGVNQLITRQKAQPRTARFTLGLFNDTLSFVCRGVELSGAPLLRSADYKPEGGTALNDAIGQIIQQLGRAVSRLTPVLVVIVTDGCDTSSCEFSRADIRQMITYRRHSHNWEFIFLGPKSGLAYAQSIGIPADHLFNFAADALGVAQILDKLGASLEAYRAGDSNYILRLQSGTEKT
jgi:von Willebrand factor type A domain